MKYLAIPLFAFIMMIWSACSTVTVSVHQPNSNSLTGTNCKLQRVLRGQEQKTDFWCWAASAHTVIEYLRDEPVSTKQCNLVSEVFRSKLIEASSGTLPSPDCCMSTAEFGTPGDPNVKIARSICLTTGWPEFVFNTDTFRMYFEGYEYESADAGPQGLSWEEIVAEICADRPMISAIHFSSELGGGTHTVVIGGYNELEDGSQWVHVYDPGYNTLEEDYYLWPYDIYLGNPGVFAHVRDYKNISLP
jgi:hypothetical protein